MPSDAAVSRNTPIPVSSAAFASAAAGIAARLERLPLTSYQRGIFLVIATAWFFDSMDLGALTFVLGSIRSEFALSPAAAGLLSSMSFIGMFLGASLAGLMADRFGRRMIFQSSMIFWGVGSILCGWHPMPSFLDWRAYCWASAWAWSSRSRSPWFPKSFRRKTEVLHCLSGRLLAAGLHLLRPAQPGGPVGGELALGVYPGGSAGDFRVDRPPQSSGIATMAGVSRQHRTG